MNIFYIEKDPQTCAQSHNDKHVVKMILEYAQLLSTAHRIIDGTVTVGLSKSGRKQTRYALPDDRDGVLYSATHVNHPSAKWARDSLANYSWLYQMWSFLMEEYTHRYGKQHSSERLLDALRAAPKNIVKDKPFEDPWRAMPDDVKIGSDSLASYRNYYIKNKRGMSRWTNREMPQWFADGIYSNYGDACFIKNDVKRKRIISLPLSQHANV